MEIYIPPFARPPNVVLRFEDRAFDDGAGHTGIQRVAIYRDKAGKVLEATAQMLWDVTPNVTIKVKDRQMSDTMLHGVRPTHWMEIPKAPNVK